MGFGSLGPALALGHRLQFSLTNLWWRPNEGLLDVEHSIHLDDALTLLAHLGDPYGLVTQETQARVLHYIDQHFSIVVGDERLALEPVGVQIEADYLWVYQAHQLPRLPVAIQVSCSLLQDLFPQQANQVDLRVADNVVTRRFHRDHQLDVFTGLR